MLEFFYWIATILTWLHLGVVLISLLCRPRFRSSNGKYPPVASVIIPAYNEEAVISEAIVAWYECNPKPAQIIVVDDGSTDHTLTIVKALERKVPNLKCFSVPHIGKAKALNYALQQVKSEIVIISDADTLPQPMIMPALLTAFKHPTVVGVSASRRSMKNRGFSWLLDLEQVNGANLTRNIGNIWRSQTGMSGALSAFRKNALLAVNGYPENELSEDTAITLKIQERGDVLYVPTAIAYTLLPKAPKPVFEQHRRWLIGMLQAIYPYIMYPSRYNRKLTFGLSYLLLFRIFLPIAAPFTDYYILTLLLKQDWLDALQTATLYLGPSTFIGVIAVFFDQHPRSRLILVPISQIIIRQYTIIFLFFMAIRKIIRSPVQWD